MNEHRDDDSHIAFSDFWKFCKKSLRWIALFSAVSAVFAALYALHSPVKYVTGGSFKDSGKVRASMMDSFNSIASLASNSSAESPSIPVIKSQTVISRVVQQMGLQASILPERNSWSLFSTIKNELLTMRDNLRVQAALWKKSKRPSLPDIKHPWLFSDVHYSGEVPLHLSLEFSPEGGFTVWESGLLIGKGELREPFFGPGYLFTLSADNSSHIDYEAMHGKRFDLVLRPLADVAQEIASAISVETDKNGKSIIWIHFADRDRFLAADFINNLMESYRRYSVDDDRKIIQDQIAYLHRRQSQIASQLQSVLEDHAGRCSKELAGSGFPDVETEITFFVSNHKEYHNKLFGIELERARLGKYLDEGFVYYDRYASEGDPKIINNLLEEIRELKQQSDTIELALSRLPVQDEEQLKKNLSLQLIELEQTRQASRSIEALLESVQNGFLATLIVPDSLLHHPRYLIAMWMKRLQETQQRWLVAPPDEKEQCTEDWEHCKGAFISYLNNLKRQLEVYATNIEERVVRHQDYPTATQGLDLGAAWDIYNLYTKKLSEIEADLLQGEFIALQLQEPDFEVSSLSSASPLNDKVSQELFTKASKAALELRDQSNRSNKELARLKEDLAVQKEFLSVHLDQTLQLLRLNQKSLIEKLQTHQGLLRELIQMRLTVLQKHLREYVYSRLSNLEQEQLIIQHRQKVLREQMVNLPIKLIEKKMIDHQIEIDRTMIEQVMKLVESKNITGHLEVLQSAPLDFAIAPIHPKSCRLLFYTIAGALAGFFLGLGCNLLRVFMRGMPASERSLKKTKQKVAGELPLSLIEKKPSDLTAQEKNVFLALSNILLPRDGPKPKRLLSVERFCQGCALLLAAMLAKRGEKILYIFLNENSAPAGVADVAVQKHPYGYDAATLDFCDGFLTPEQLVWIKGKENDYSLVICSLFAEPNSPVALGLESFFPRRVVAAGNLQVEDLSPWFSSEGDNKCTAFIVT
jgi:uncharacterized protein involved in exopolysaccharide biosynthesis